MRHSILKFILGLILGFFLHKVVEELYEWRFNLAFVSPTCRTQYLKDVKSNVLNPLTIRYICTRREMGSARYLEYLLIRYHYMNASDHWYY